MIQLVVILSLFTAGIYAIFQPGMILEKPRAMLATGMDQIFGHKWSKIIQKPLWGCLPCMSMLWTIVFMQDFDITIILAVCGLNTLINQTYFNE